MNGSQLNWKRLIGFLVLHLGVGAVLWTGASTADWIACGVLYLVRMFGITAGFHRYFAHRGYHMGRGMQFVMAFLGTSALQKGPLWWAGHHRHHHQFSDTPEDVHSPIKGFFWSHFLWVFYDDWVETPVERVPDLAKFPELVWLNKYWGVPPLILAGLTLALGGMSMLVVGFLLSTVLTMHATYMINSVAHVFGKRRYATSDTSRNSWLLAMLTLGEGWHNNHHHFQGSARQGFFWWEIDLSYYALRFLSLFGLVSHLRGVPDSYKFGYRLEVGQLDEGELRVAKLREAYLPQPGRWTMLTQHILNLSAATAIATLLVVFGALRGNPYFIVGASLFGAVLILFFVVRSLDHFKKRPWVEAWDQSNLYLLIAGGLTPIGLSLCREHLWAWFLMGGVWLLGISLFVLKLLSVKQRSFLFILQLSLALSFMGTLIPLVFEIPPTGFYALAGSLSLFYTAYKLRPYFETMNLHVAFHGLLVMGSVSHFFFLNDTILVLV